MLTKKISVFAIIFGIILFSANFQPKSFSACAAYEQKPYASMIVIESSSGRVLEGENIDKRLPMASTTKILTAIMVLENQSDLDTKHIVPNSSIGTEGSSMFLRSGEQFSIRQLLYGLMLSSGNDAAVALSVICFGSEDGFRAKAKEYIDKLGLKNTSIVTPHGLHDDNHYTSAYDLSMIARYAMKNETFREIVKTRYYDIPKSETNEARKMRSKNKFLHNNENAIGIKTGYTPEAGRCLVASSQKNGTELICVLLNCGQMEEIAASLLNKNHDMYSVKQLLKANNHITKIKVKDSKTTEVNVYSKNGFSYPLSEAEYAKIRIVYDYPVEVESPIKSEQVIGKVKIYLANQLLFEEDIYTIEQAKSDRYIDILHEVIKNFA